MNIFKELRHFPEFVKLSHSVFALPFALAALILAMKGFPDWRTLFLVVGAVISARFTAMAFNRIVDTRYDALNPRTANRHLPSEKISTPTAWSIVVVGASTFVFISITINQLAGILSPVALIIILGYSFTKRFTSLSHFFLGAALGLAPLGAWVSVRGTLNDLAPWLLALAVIFWVAGFDIIYALQDLEFDKTHGLYSMVVALGPKRSMGLVRLLHAMMFLILVAIGLLLNLKPIYFAGLVIVFVSLIWEQWLMCRVTKKNLQIAFLQANALASFGYLGAVIAGVIFR